MRIGLPLADGNGRRGDRVSIGGEMKTAALIGSCAALGALAFAGAPLGGALAGALLGVLAGSLKPRATTQR